MLEKQNKRLWRKIVKKLQRKRRRQTVARQRDKDLEEAELAKLKDPQYKAWLENRKEIERQEQLLHEKEKQEQEEEWLRRELLAQMKFQKEQMKRKAEEAKLEEERLKQEQYIREQREVHRKKLETLKLEAEKAAKEFDSILQCMQQYLDEKAMKTPPRLESFVQSRPAEKSCEIYDKTNCCRYGLACSFNHRRPLLAKIIVIRHFFHHPLLEQHEHEEYSTADSSLELNERDLRDYYDEFCEDVWPVLQEYGDIINFRTVRNTQPHLRGHVFVEYAEKRSALKAFINLQNRYYASKRLNVEFSNIVNWRNGVCGPDLGGKCPKGGKCNFLHLMKNAENKYNAPMHNPKRNFDNVTRCSQYTFDTPNLSWSVGVPARKQTHNWRWSESPEIELKSSKRDVKETSLIGDGKARAKTPENTHKSSRDQRRRSSKKRNSTKTRSRTPNNDKVKKTSLYTRSTFSQSDRSSSIRKSYSKDESPKHNKTKR